MDGRRQLVFWCVVDDRGQYTALQRADGARALRSARAGSGQSTGAKLTYAKKVLIPNGTHYYLFETEKRLCLALDQPKIALDAVPLQPTHLGKATSCVCV